MQLQGNYAPIAAYEKMDGEIIGYLFIATDINYNLSAHEVIQKMESEFEKRLAQKSIRSYTIYYHSEGNSNRSVISNRENFSEILISYKSAQHLAGSISLPYFYEDDVLTFRGLTGFSSEQNNIILNTQLVAGKDYFQERVEIKAETTENPIGLKITKVNSGSLGNMWSGVLGFERLNSKEGKQLLMEYSAFALSTEVVRSNDEILITEVSFKNIAFRGIKTRDDASRSIYPVVNTQYIIDVENKHIYEWAHVNGIEAVISGNGRNTFGLTYFATDYALNKKKYHSIQKHNLQLSGIIYVLEEGGIDLGNIDPSLKVADNFVAYLPNKELAETGCFDFTGILEKFEEVNILRDVSAKGYMLKVKLINNPDLPDFFTIDMFVNKENMRFQKLKNGMKLKGLFQLQGQISE